MRSKFLRGFILRLICKNIPPDEYYAAYLETYLERDVADLIQIKNKYLFVKFLRLCAGRIGQLLNKDDLSRDVGISPVTIENWISVLEATFIVYRLRPWYNNLNKRIVKSPKLYFYDCGFAAFLLGIENANQLFTHPLRGNLFENLQIMEALKWRYNQGKNDNLFFYKDNKNNEVDLIMEFGNDVLAIEIKSSSNYSQSFLKGLNIFEKLNLSMPWKKVIILGTNENTNRTDVDIVKWDGLSEYLRNVIL